MVVPSYMVSCTSFIPANAPEQTVFYDNLKSNIDFPPTFENLHCALILSPGLLPTICIGVLMV